MTVEDVITFQRQGFGQLIPKAVLERVFALAQRREWAKGYRLISQGELPSELAFILDGRLSLTCERSDGEQAVIDVIDSGYACPLANVVLAEPTSVSITTLTPVYAAILPAHTFRTMMREDIDLASAVAQKLARGWVKMVDQNKALKLQNTNQRLAHFLLQHTHADDGAVEIRLSDERRLMARRLGMTPESLSRAIAQLQSCGVEFNQQRVLIRDVDRLRRFCGLEIVF